MTKPKKHLAHNPMANIYSAMPKCRQRLRTWGTRLRPSPIVRRHNQVTCKNCLRLIAEMKKRYAERKK